MLTVGTAKTPENYGFDAVVKCSRRPIFPADFFPFGDEGIRTDPRSCYPWE
jgi:hypothetical protein